MHSSSITRILGQAGVHLLNILLQHVQELNDSVNPRQAILETWLLEITSNPDQVYAAVEDAQDRFARYSGEHSQANIRSLDVFEVLLDSAGPLQETFAENIWLTYIFNAQYVAEILWNQYSDILHRLEMEHGHSNLPRSWRDWILPTQTFMQSLEYSMIDVFENFESLLAAEEILEITDNLSTGDTGYFNDDGIIFVDRASYSSVTLTDYLSTCAKMIGHIDWRGYPRSSHTSIPLSDIYIPLHLVSLTDYYHPEQYIRYQSAGYKDPVWHTFQNPLGYRELEDLPALDIDEVLRDSQLVVLLGESGSGKTALLRNLVLSYAQHILEGREQSLVHVTDQQDFDITRPIPLYVDLADFIENRMQDELLENFTLRRVGEMIRDDEVIPLLTQMLEEGRCIIMLDGLDQVVSDAQRRLLVSNVVEAAALWGERQNRVIVTSRFVGYDIAPLPDEFAVYLIRPLSRNQINALLLRWKLALSLLQRPLMEKEKAEKRAYAEMLSLARQITTNSRLYAVLNTPLMLRMLVTVYHQGMILAPQKAAVYQYVTDVLIREWRLPQVETNRPEVLEHEAVPLLSELAYWLQSTRPTGMLSERELREILARIWHKMRPSLDLKQVFDSIDSFLGALRDSGVLIELNRQRYGFIYQGLQEYFAARYLVASYTRAARRIRELLHDPRWDEVITLAFGSKALDSREDASELLETAILARGERAAQFGHASSPFESLLKRDLFFAARLLGQGVEVSPIVADGIVKNLMELWLYGDAISLGRFSLIFDLARRHLMNLEGTSASRMIPRIAAENFSDPDEYTQAFAVDAITFSSVFQEDVQASIVALGNTAPLPVRQAIVRALARMELHSVEVYRLLIWLTADVDDEVNRLSRKALLKAGGIPRAAMRPWIGYLSSDEPRQQRVGMRRLKQIGMLPEDVIDELFNLLDSPNPDIRQRAVETLAAAGNLPEDVLTVICRVIMHMDAQTREIAIDAFAHPVMLPDMVIENLVRWSDDPDARVRLASIRALGSCLNVTSQVLEALLVRLDPVTEPSDSIRAAAVEPLVMKGQDYPGVLHQISHSAQDNIVDVRRMVASALRHIPNLDREMQSVMLTLLNDSDVSVRETALESVGKVSNPGEQVIDYLVTFVYAPDQPISKQAVKALASLSDLPINALVALVQALETNQDNLGREIVSCLKRHTPLDAEVVNRVMDLAVLLDSGAGLANTSTAGLRALALEILGHTLGDTPAVLQIMRDAANRSENTVVRAAALRGMANARVVSPSVVQVLQTSMKNAPIEVRCAAGITLGHLVRNLPDPPLSADDLLSIARDLAAILMDLPGLTSWEADSEVQNEVLKALSWVVARARPTLPLQPSHLENTSSYLY